MKTRAVKTLVPVVDGTNGTDAVVYYFTASVEQVVVTSGQPDVTSIVIQLYRRVGNTAPRLGGIFDVEIFLRNGTRTQARAAGEWTLRDREVEFSTIRAIRCGLYSGGMLLAQKEITFINDAVQLYTWHKYADGVGSSGYPTVVYDLPRDTTRYMGVAYNKTTEEESEDPEDYEWVALPKGEDGKNFSPKGIAYGHFHTMQELQEYEFLESGKGYLVDAASIDQQPYKATLYGSRWGTLAAVEGDSYIIESDKRMWVAIGNVWVDHGILQGPPGDPGKNGQDAETWSMTVTPKTVRWDGLGSSASSVVIMTYKTKGANTALTTPYQVEVTKVYRNGQPQSTSVHGGPVVAINIASEASVLEKLEISLKINPSVTVCRETVQFVRELNRMVIPEGVYDETVSYTCTEIKSPLVLEGEQYYYMVFEGISTGVRPSESAAENGIWRLADKYQVVIVQAIMANFGKIGSAVFYGDWMISQYGNDGRSADYSLFDPSNPESATFAPNIAIDFLRGKVWMSDVNIKGRIEATSGEFNGIMRANLMYSQPFILSNQNYVINFSSQQYSNYLLLNYDGKDPSTRGTRTITLPKASACPGVELSFFLHKGTTYCHDVILQATGTDKLYFTNMENSQYVFLPDMLTESQKCVLIPNNEVKIKSYFDRWYVVTGYVNSYDPY